MDFTFIDDARRCKRLGNSYPKSLVLIFNFNDEKTLFWAYPYQNGIMYALIVANVCHPSNPLRISAPANLCVKNKVCSVLRLISNCKSNRRSNFSMFAVQFVYTHVTIHICYMPAGRSIW